MQWIQSLTYPMSRKDKVKFCLKYMVDGWQCPDVSTCVTCFGATVCPDFLIHLATRASTSLLPSPFHFYLFWSISQWHKFEAAQLPLLMAGGWAAASRQSAAAAKLTIEMEITLQFHSVTNLFSTFCRKSTLATNQECTLNSVPMH